MGRSAHDRRQAMLEVMSPQERLDYERRELRQTQRRIHTDQSLNRTLMFTLIGLVVFMIAFGVIVSVFGQQRAR